MSKVARKFCKLSVEVSITSFSTVSQITKSCIYCGCPFQVEIRDHNRGRGKYCTSECLSRAFKTRIIPQIPNCKCACCGVELYKSLSKLKAAKHHLIFCSRACKEKSQRIGGIQEIQPPHYKDGESAYRKIARREKDATSCERCGYNIHPEILEVHHRDGNRKNNALENLEILCPNCHDWHHYNTKTGKHAPKKRMKNYSPS